MDSRAVNIVVSGEGGKAWGSKRRTKGMKEEGREGGREGGRDGGREEGSEGGWERGRQGRTEGRTDGGEENINCWLLLSSN